MTTHCPGGTIGWNGAALRAAGLALVLVWSLGGSALAQPEPRYTYKEFDGIYVFYKPHAADSYRKLLPPVFDMPDAPLVEVFVADYYKMDAATQPYLEAAVFLLAKYRGEEVWHCISMPVTSDEARRLGVTYRGYPKVMGAITLQRGEAEYSGAVKLEGRPVMNLRLIAKGHVVTQEEQEWFRALVGIPCMNILNGMVFNPLGDAPRPKVSPLEWSRRFPDKMEVKVGQAQLTLNIAEAKEGLPAGASAFTLAPSKIVLAYYMKNKFGFRFPPLKLGD